MEFQIQLQNETDFRSFEFPNASVIDKDRNCVRKQIISITYAFTEEWNEAEIRCKYKHSKDFDETPVFVLSRECFKVYFAWVLAMKRPGSFCLFQQLIG